MNNQGWMAIHRKIKDTWLWKEKPFSRGQAWIDLLLMANWEEKKVLVNGNLEVVKRGERITSLRKLSESWGWSTTKVKKFLEVLKGDNMIDYKSDTKKTVYRVLNYNDYQDIKDEEINSEVTQKKQPKTAFLENSENGENFSAEKRNTEKTSPSIENPNGTEERENAESNSKVTQKKNRSKTEVKQKKTNNNINNYNNNKQYIVEQSPTVDVEEKKTKKDNPPYEEIIDYLNVKVGKNFKATTKTHQSKINGRWREGYRLDDFKQVIDNKVKQWGNDPNMDKYLRPDTLFSTKFESYLNEKDIKPQVDNTRGNNYQNYDDDYEDKEMEWARKKFEKDVTELMKGAKQ